MDLEHYRAFTTELARRLEGEPDVVGLVAVGSMAETGRLPDVHSDHDFWVVTEPGGQERFRTEQSWLPGTDAIVMAFRETTHGVKVLYDDAHVLEYAVFELDELVQAKVNDYRVLIDRGGVSDRIREVRASTRAWSEATYTDPWYLYGQILTQLVIGVARHRRGEGLSGHRIVKASAVEHLAWLATRRLRPHDPSLADDIDPLRRFERRYPELSRKLEQALLRPVPDFASTVLTLLREILRRGEPDLPMKPLEVVERYLA